MFVAVFLFSQVPLYHLIHRRVVSLTSNVFVYIFEQTYIYKKDTKYPFGAISAS